MSSRLHASSMNFLTSMIDISRLVEVKLESFYFGKLNKHLLFEIVTIIGHSTNLSSLIIYNRYCKYELYPFLNDLCSILPRQIKYLRLPINRLNQIEMIMKRCPYLSVIQVAISRSRFSKEVVDWFSENTLDSICRKQNSCDFIWIGKKKTNDIRYNPKRIKLNDD
ncbi:unnamed protein product [Adineta ricciae]|uniref:Uncharacterized protein n=1 Tax=Adineta ricciae TaxID=249248 RepID=A0A814XEI3_ADIRI|nr:unnamed protein product [Adineta ricciae]CAF1210081.1 unnamed protein product [Adineta ricciae]